MIKMSIQEYIKRAGKHDDTIEMLSLKLINLVECELENLELDPLEMMHIIQNLISNFSGLSIMAAINNIDNLLEHRDVWINYIFESIKNNVETRIKRMQN